MSIYVFKTGLSGDGSDELFHGYIWYAQIEKSMRLFKIPHFVRKLLLNKIVTSLRKYHSLSGLRENEFSRLIGQKQASFYETYLRKGKG